MADIWQPITLGGIELPNRFVMAPMTRSRAQYDGTPGELAAEYYSQRANVGLIVTEGTQPSDGGQGYLTTPGIYTDAQSPAGGRLLTPYMQRVPLLIAEGESLPANNQASA